MSLAPVHVRYELEAGAVWRARLADRAAATRLGVEIVEEIHD